MSATRAGSLGLGLVAALLMALPAAAEAKRPLRLGFFDGAFGSADALVREQALDRSLELGAEITLSFVSWRATAPTDPEPGFDATDPGDPGYDWTRLDATLRDVEARGLRPVVAVTLAPSWAEGDDRPPGVTPGTWKPDAAELAKFATALASRYTGSFSAPQAPGSGPLPRVDLFQVWAEANLESRLAPQWTERSGSAKFSKRKPLGPKIYRPMLNRFYDAVKAVDPTIKVLTTGTAPYGHGPRDIGPSMRPLYFWRKMLCLQPSLRPTACPKKARFDILAHHPINTSGRPTLPPVHPDDISSANLGALTEVLRTAERRRRVSPPGRKPLWVTEFWYPSDPPNPEFGKPAAVQARFIAESLYLFWQAGAKVAINLRVRDAPVSAAPAPFDGTGLDFVDGSPKPAATAFSFPFFADRRAKRKVFVWGKAPVAAKVLIERKARGGWKRVGSIRAGNIRVFSGRIRTSGRGKLRARVADVVSRPWKLR